MKKIPLRRISSKKGYPSNRKRYSIWIDENDGCMGCKYNYGNGKFHDGCPHECPRCETQICIEV